MNRLNRNQRRELERELADVSNPTPTPPADLLDRIKNDIPADLGADHSTDDGTDRRWKRRAAYRLAATLAVGAFGIFLAYRSTHEIPAPAGVDALAAKPHVVQRETSPISRFQQELQPASEAGKVRAQSRSVESPADSNVAAAPESPAPAQKGVKDERLPLKGKTSETAAVSTTPMPPSPSPSVEGLSGSVMRQAPPEAKTEMEKKLSVRRAQAEPELDAGTQSLRENGLRQNAPAPPPAAPAVRSGQLQRELGAARSRSDEVTDRVYDVPASGAPSAGGEREPNEQAAGDMYFRPTGTNPFIDSSEDRLSTFALDVDTGSYTLARSYLERGALPPAEAIRVEEFVNAQRYDDRAPRRGDFTLVAEGAPSPFAPAGDYRLLRFAVRARDVDPGSRRPANLTFVVDVSGSMNRENRLGLVKRALGLLLDELRPDDRVALVVFGTRGRVLLRPTRDLEAIRQAIDWLRPEGSTNAEEGLRLGYQMADEAYRPGSINRIVLCSDGVANVGATGPESILERIGAEARRGIELTTVGFGMGNYNDALMEQLADQGDGSYHYVDSLDEARKVFVDELEGTLQTIAKDAKVQVEFDPRTVDRWRLLGYENRDVADRDFRNDRVDAGEVGAGHSATALYEVRMVRGARRGDRLATLHLRWKSTTAGRVQEAALELRVGDLEDSFRSASDNLRRAAIAAELAEMLEHSYYAQDASWSALAAEAHRLDRDTRADDSTAALVAMIDRASRLAGPRPLPRRDPPEREDD
jgi:Ca-activated chloride channel family protein